MKSAIAAFLSVTIAIAMGFGALHVLSVGPTSHYGRDPLPIIVFAAIFLVVAGFIYGRWFYKTVKACAGGLAAYGALVYALVAYFGGTVGGIYVDWFLAILGVTLVPWLIGAATGKYAQRIHFT